MDPLAVPSRQVAMPAVACLASFHRATCMQEAWPVSICMQHSIARVYVATHLGGTHLKCGLSKNNQHPLQNTWPTASLRWVDPTHATVPTYAFVNICTATICSAGGSTTWPLLFGCSLVALVLKQVSKQAVWRVKSIGQLSLSCWLTNSHHMPSSGHAASALASPVSRHRSGIYHTPT